MALCLEVGILPDLVEMDDEGYRRYKEQFCLISEALSNARVDNHVEPEEVEGIFSCDMAGYSTIHCLRRFAAHLALEKRPPPPGTPDAYKDPLLSEYHQRFQAGEELKFQHTIMHSDAEGFYVPVKFRRVINAEALQLAGGYLGSTQRLEAECTELDGLLREVDPPAKRHWFAKPEVRYGNERFASHQLLQACEASIRMNAAIVFC